MFRSFFLGGFESTTARNMRGQWIDQIAATEHDVRVDEDYRLLRETGLLAAREAVRWPLVDQGGRLDLRSVDPFLAASERHGVDVIWDLFHYGYPEDLDPFSGAFIERFAAYCHAAANYISARTAGTCSFTPVNEPSYFAWAAGSARRFAPYRRDRAPDLKIALARAAIAGAEAIWAAAPGSRIISVDPVCHVVPPAGHEGLHEGAEHFNERVVFESWDMVSGRLLPELGGSRAHLGIIGINYYWTNQWEIGREETPLPADDPRHVSLSQLMERVWRRYGGELLITETSHIGPKRAEWLACVADECSRALEAGVPLRGVCLYPILGMPEWHDRRQWARMGLWDLYPRDGRLVPVEYAPMREALREAQRKLDPIDGDLLEAPAGRA